MSKSTAERLAPLTGALFVVLAVITFVVLGGSTPDSDATAQTVQSFYSSHYSNQVAAAFTLTFAAMAFMFFTGCITQSLRESGGSGRLANTVLAAGAVTGVSFVVVASVHLALAEAAHHAATLQAALTLNVLDGNDYPLFVAGLGVFVFAASLAAIRHGGLPTWLGWLGIVIGIVTVSPLGFFGFIACGVWVLIASVVLTMAGPVGPAEPERSITTPGETEVTDESAMPRSRAPVA